MENVHQSSVPFSSYLGFSDPVVSFPCADHECYSIEAKKALKPDVFQEFELREKTVLSHNVAM